MFTELENEKWKDIPGYEGLYQVSDLGRVYSYITSKIMIGGNSHGYRSMSLRNSNNKVSHVRVHRLVLYAFEGVCHLSVDHINGIKDDNRLINLRYCTTRENSHFYVSTQKRVSDFIGVTYIKKSKRWRSRIFINNTEYNLGFYNTEYEAKKAYDNALYAYLNNNEIPNYIREDITSKFKGVCWCKKSNKWNAHIFINSKYYNLGYFLTEIEASDAYNKAKDNWNYNEILPILKSTLYSSKFKGVTFRKSTNRWIVQINKKYIGSYSTEEEAAEIAKKIL